MELFGILIPGLILSFVYTPEAHRNLANTINENLYGFRNSTSLEAENVRRGGREVECRSASDGQETNGSANETREDAGRVRERAVQLLPAQSTKFVEGRVVGGQEVDISQYPFVVSVRRFGSHSCGGSLVTPLWVLTAAHCCYYKKALVNPEDMKVVAGASSSTARRQFWQSAQRRDVNSLFPHNNYDPDGKPADYDIALLGLASAMPLGGAIATVPLHQPGDPDPRLGSSCTVVGWGHVSAMAPDSTEKPQASPTLRKVDLAIVSSAQCRLSFPGLSLDRHVCTQTTGKDACIGDSGGPLLCGGKQFAVVSFGRGCAWPAIPGVYQRVDAHETWRFRIMGADFRSSRAKMDAVCGMPLPLLLLLLPWLRV